MKEYYIRKENGSRELVTGRPIKIAGFEDYDFFYRKLNGYFIISEVSTGKCVCVEEKLRHARTDATVLLTRHKKKFTKFVRQGGMT